MNTETCATRDMYHGQDHLGLLNKLYPNIMNVAILDASKKCQRLHRDISANNVILGQDPETNM